MTINGMGTGVEEKDFYAFNVGDYYEYEGKRYLISRKESLRKYTDGKYGESPVFLVLRGLSPSGETR